MYLAKHPLQNKVLDTFDMKLVNYICSVKNVPASVLGDHFAAFHFPSLYFPSRPELLNIFHLVKKAKK